jgi:hypothetical protein
MSELARMAAEYFRFGNYRITRETADFLEARTDDSSARILLWADDTALTESSSLSGKEKAEREAREAAWLRRFSEEMRAAPGAAGYFIVPQRVGLSAQFVSNATKTLNGGIRVPIQFFDSEYRYDEGGKKARASVAAPVFETAAKLKRVPQAFFRRRGLAETDREPGPGDLVDYLKTWIAQAGQSPRFCLIDGSAGGGKTVAFNALATHAYKAFVERKNRQGKDGEAGPGTAGRPVIFLPQHLRGTGEVGHIDDILAAANETDMAASMTPGQLRWLLLNGFSLWMFDGLDEFYEGSEGFFNEIGAALDTPGSRACVLICTRDSLLTSSAAMRAFVESRLAGKHNTEILELAPWGEAAWRTIATLELGEGAKAQKFVTSLTSSPIVADLARLPFYSRVLIERFRDGVGLPSSEFELLDTIFERMIGREHDKAIFRWRDFVDEDLLSGVIEDEIENSGGLLNPDNASTRKAVSDLLDAQGRENVAELISALAHAHRRSDANGGAAGGLEALDIKALTDISYISNDMSREEHLRRLNVLVQFAFFGPGRRAGTVDFTHPILADYLAGRYALILLRRGKDALPSRSDLNPTDLALPKAAIQQAVGAAPFDPESIFFRAIEWETGRDRELQALFKAMRQVHFERANVKQFMEAILASL